MFRRGVVRGELVGWRSICSSLKGRMPTLRSCLLNMQDTLNTDWLRSAECFPSNNLAPPMVSQMLARLRTRRYDLLVGRPKKQIVTLKIPLTTICIVSTQIISKMTQKTNRNVKVAPEHSCFVSTDIISKTAQKANRNVEFAPDEKLQCCHPDHMENCPKSKS